jgi:hypothetical protein|tara:strand:+ start:1039 stop:1299 length:261 start_codon:yes stop_codon:yes gene_type:complete
MKVFFSVAMLFVLSACSAGQIAASKGKPEYVHVGCHVVTKTPSKDGSHAFDFIGDLRPGDYLYFKQVRADGTVGPITTARPCVAGK